MMDANKFRPCLMKSYGDTEIVMEDCLIVWEKWDAKTEVGRNADGLLVAVRLLGFANAQEEAFGLQTKK